MLNLENVLHDPRYLQTTFVLIHGGFPFDREARPLAAALAEMMAAHEITEAGALQFAHMYLHDTAAGLYK